MGEFRGSDISYSGLEVAGEPGTGRVQMMVKLVVELPTGIDPCACHKARWNSLTKKRAEPLP